MNLFTRYSLDPRRVGTWVRLAIALLVTFFVGRWLAPHTVRHDGVLVADNVFLTIGLVTLEAMRVLENMLTFTRLVNRQYDDKFAVDGAKIGQTLTVRKPPRYVGATGAVLVMEDSVEDFATVTLDSQLQQGLRFSTRDLTLSIDNFASRFLTPAIASIANRCDALGLALYKNVANAVFETTANVTINPVALLTYLTAGAILDDNATPQDGRRSVVLSPTMQAVIVDALKGLYNQSQAISQQYVTGHMASVSGFEWYMDQNCRTHTVGALGGAPLVNLGGQTGSTLNLKGAGGAIAGYFKQGDVITLAGVYGVNPQLREQNDRLQQFVVTADTDTTGDTFSVPIYPPITPSGGLQTVNTSPADGAIVLVFGHASAMAGKALKQALSFHEDAFTLASADLHVPNNQDMAGRVSDDQLGMSLRMVRAFDIFHDEFPTRVDALVGWAALRPELAVRVCGVGN